MLLKNPLTQMLSLVNIAKFLRALILKNFCERLLLKLMHADKGTVRPFSQTGILPTNKETNKEERRTNLKIMLLSSVPIRRYLAIILR